MADLMDPVSLASRYGDTLIGLGANVLAAGAIFLIGVWIAGAIRGAIRRLADRNPRIDRTLTGFASSTVYYIVVAFVLIAVLNRFGVETTTFVAAIGAATLAIGLALQGTLSHVASGVMLVLFRPYRVGDYVTIAGHSGTVRDITLFTTELATVDNVKIIIPNGECWAGSVVNFSGHATRRLDIDFSIGYDEDIEKATQTILRVIDQDGRFINEPAAPWVRVVNLGESSVDLQMRAWLATSDYWEARFAMIRKVKEAFDAAGIEIPYPHQVEIVKAPPA